jgi:hypothetical protein
MKLLFFGTELQLAVKYFKRYGDILLIDPKSKSENFTAAE